MSGPTTVLIGGDPVVIVLSALAIRAAAAMREAYAHAAQLEAEHQASRAALGKAAVASMQAGRQALLDELERTQSQYRQLQAQADRLGLGLQLQAACPARPDSDDSPALAAYLRGLQAFAGELKGLLLNESARRLQDAALPEHIDLAASQGASVSPSKRLLARIAHLEEVPLDIAELARELDATPPGMRFDLLESELGARIQSHLESRRQRQVQEATAVVVEQSLKDLGYQVEDIASTLFVEGGIVHFRRAGWGNYMVRMRVDARQKSANFNVIKAVQAGQNERSVLDHIAEDRWCAEFPALLQALAARGVTLQVTRRLQAGELPVQQVAHEQLPHLADEENVAHLPAQAQSKPIPK